MRDPAPPRPAPSPRARRLAAVSCAVFTLVTHAASEVQARPIRRADVVRLAPHAATTRAARVRAAAARSAADRSGVVALEDPTISGTIGPRIERSTADLAAGAELSVPVDLFGQRGARVDAAEAEARAVEAAARSAQTGPLRDALLLHTEVLAAKARRALLAERLRLADELEAAVTRKRAAGEVAANDVALIRVQRGRDRAALAAIDGELAATERRLAALLMLPDGEAADAVGPLVPPERPHAGGPTSLVVEAAAAEAHAAAARVAREEVARRPTVRVLATYELDQGAHVVTGGVSIPLPIYGAGSARLAAARGEAAATAIELAGVRRRVAAEREGARLRVEATARALDALRPVVVEARGIAERAQRAYAAGESDVATFVLLRREALEGELAVVDAEEAHAVAVIDALLLEGGWAR
jgi:cobalt-zinc-cadmium efflux system outer membrane protein